MSRYRLALLFLAGILLTPALLPKASADEILDDILLKTGANGEVNVEIKFTVPIQYLRHFPQKKSPSVAIYFKVLSSVPQAQWQNYQQHRTPPSDLIHDIAISTTDPSTGPKIQMQFTRAADFSVSMGRNAQSLMIHVIPDVLKQKGDGAPALVPPVVAAVPVAAPPLPAPAAAAPSLAAASGQQPSTASAVPSGEVSAPNIALPPSQWKRVRLPLGGKDGLPPFPDVEQVPPEGAKAASANSSPVDQIKRANDQAAVLMLKGGRELLAGQPIAAVDSFNGVLDLPPSRYTQDAQLWVAISREKSGQLAKAVLEFQTYLKLYPDGRSVKWVNARLAMLKIAAPGVFAELAKPTQAAAPAKIQNTAFQTSAFGSLGMYYYTGASRFSTSGGLAQTPSITKTVVDQKTFMTNFNTTLHSYNNEYDNRLVFQDFYAANLLPGQRPQNRLGAAFYELRDRIEGYSFRLGRQSGLGGGVMGRFDGLSAGYDVGSNYRINVVGGRLADQTLDSRPFFYGSSVDFGIKDPLGGSLYGIVQKSQGLIDRKAVGGNLRYFNPAYNLMSMFDYDTQFRALNIFTLQGTVMGAGTTDFNFLLDRRRSPILDLRNAVNGTVTPISTLLANGWTFQDLLLLADQRTGSTTSLQLGMTNHLSEKWNIGTDVSLSKNSGLQASGTLLPDGSVGLEGFVPVQPPSGNIWMISERLTGNGIIKPRDITNFVVSYSKSQLNNAESFQFSNHSDLQEKWSLDTTARLSLQSDTTGGKAIDMSPTVRVTYRMVNNFSIDSQLGMDVTKQTSSVFQTTTTTMRYFASIGFQWVF